MRAVRYAGAEGARIGRLEDDHIVDAGPAGRYGFVPSDDAWDALEAAAGQPLPLAGLRLLHPVEPSKIACIGLNYADHAAETGAEVPPTPIVFAKFPSALIGPGAPIVLPVDEPRPDYEAELAVIIGRRVRRVSGADALAAVGGYTAFNDVSGREAQFAAGRQFTRGKSYDTFAPMGPCIVRSDGTDLGDLAVRCRLSGETMQDSTTANLIFDVATLIEHLSAAFTLEPGDVIATGTPGGVGDQREPPRYLRDGDVVEVEVEGVGVLTNPCAAER